MSTPNLLHKHKLKFQCVDRKQLNNKDVITTYLIQSSQFLPHLQLRNLFQERYLVKKEFVITCIDCHKKSNDPFPRSNWSTYLIRTRLSRG